MPANATTNPIANAIENVLREIFGIFSPQAPRNSNVAHGSSAKPDTSKQLPVAVPVSPPSGGVDLGAIVKDAQGVYSIAKTGVGIASAASAAYGAATAGGEVAATAATDAVATSATDAAVTAGGSAAGGLEAGGTATTGVLGGGAAGIAAGAVGGAAITAYGAYELQSTLGTPGAVAAGALGGVEATSLAATYGIAKTATGFISGDGFQSENWVAQQKATYGFNPDPVVLKNPYTGEQDTFGNYKGQPPIDSDEGWDKPSKGGKKAPKL